MDEIVTMQHAENLEHFEEFIRNLVLGVKENGCANEARKCDSIFLTRNVAEFVLFKIEEMIFDVAENTAEQCQLKDVITPTIISTETLHYDGFHALV